MKVYIFIFVIIHIFLQTTLVINKLVPGAGLEPARHRWRGILSPLCLPIPPPGHIFDNYTSVFMEAEAGIEPALTALQAAA